MAKKEIKRALRIPLYSLYYIKDVRKKNLYSKDAASITESEYTKNELKDIVNSLEWAIDNPSYDFNKLLPDIPHSNKEILHFLKREIKIFKEALKIKG